MSNGPKRGTVGGLLAFTKYVVDKKYAPPNAIRPWESAINAVFSSVFNEAAQGTDVLDLDLDEVAVRFANATGDRYKAESRVVYIQRVGKAIRSYREYLDHPDRPPNLAVRKPRTSRPAQAQTPTNGNGAGTTNASDGASSAPLQANQRRYQFPLRNGDAELILPREFYGVDAERLTTFIQSLVFEPMRELTATTGGGTDES